MLQLLDVQTETGGNLTGSPNETLEKELTQVLPALGLHGWTVIWSPANSPKERGRAMMEDKIILLHDKDREKARETFAHEILEIRMRAIVRPWRVTVNSLIEAMEKIYYEEKERAIDAMLPFTLKEIDEIQEKME